ncbi:hypothetical protein H1W37_11270 [Stappia taiwanensis]|uniref:Uncharacterized protein n=1 Tax=Stappia taiwanensis TaxID=992267 RepID=A0A838XUQ4_9HYPH|nr:hypothetical protein [Stappia taiwanensis]MBA4612236.1 hypothetical protein [Stappia taiwanensis]GGE92489.1 hypothetical protein GCM10007285_20140 [Stappia taiwanensis]
MTDLRRLTFLSLVTVSMAIAGSQAMAQSSTSGGNGGGGTASAGTDQGASVDGSSGGGRRGWGPKSSVAGPILCATPSCMAAAAAVTHVPGKPRRPVRPRPVRLKKEEGCSKIRYVYPNGTVIIQSDCPRPVLGTHQ